MDQLRVLHVPGGTGYLYLASKQWFLSGGEHHSHLGCLLKMHISPWRDPIIGIFNVL